MEPQGCYDKKSCRTKKCLCIITIILTIAFSVVVGLLVGAAISATILGALAAVIVLAVVLGLLLILAIILMICKKERCKCNYQRSESDFRFWLWTADGTDKS